MGAYDLDMVEPLSKEKEKLALASTPLKQPPSLRQFRLLSTLVFLSLSASLSFLAYPSWSWLSSGLVSESQADAQSSETEWQDNIWPLRPPMYWDISTDYPYKRLLEYDVTEGTWLRLDVHPNSGDIVFDMAGDLWCLPGSSYNARRSEDEYTRAVPIMLGVPHDSDPHFSPEGDRLVWRSDAELGVENIWITRWRGCEAMDVRPQRTVSGELLDALKDQDYEETLLAQGVAETEGRKRRRLVRDGRLGARRVTNETYRWVSDARFHPSGQKVVATKWYTSARSLGAGEGWEYDLPSLGEVSPQPRIPAGAGRRLLGRSLPSGWEDAQYGDQQIGPEQVLWHGDDTLIYSKNVKDEGSGAFRYSKDVHNGIYAIYSHNLTTKETSTLVGAFPGGASRPELSQDGRTLAFVQRVRDKSVLVLKDLQTGTIHHAFDGLTYDLTTISAPMGTYPSFAFTPSDSGRNFQDGIIIWAAGHIYYIPLSINSRGERVPHPTLKPRVIRFKAHIEKRVAETLSFGTETKDGALKGFVDVVGMETQKKIRVRAMKELWVNEQGDKVVFQAAGMNYVQRVHKNRHTDKTTSKYLAERVPCLYPGSFPYFSPSFIPHVENDAELVIHVRWSDVDFSTFEVADIHNGRAYEVVGLPLGRYFTPAVSSRPGQKNSRKLAFIKTGGDLLTGDIVATAGVGVYVGNIELPDPKKATVAVRDLRFIKMDVDPDSVMRVRWIDLGYEKKEGLLIQQTDKAIVVDVDQGPNSSGKYSQWTVAEGRMSMELVISDVKPQFRFPPCPWPWGCGDWDLVRYMPQKIAFVDFFHVYLVDGKNIDWRAGEKVWSRPGDSSAGLTRLSLDGGHDIAWTGDGKKIFWFLGPYLHSLEVSKLNLCANDIKHDPSNYGIQCIKDLVEYQEVVVEHPTDITRLKNEAREQMLAQLEDSNATLSHHEKQQLLDNSDVLVLINATLLTMETGDSGMDLVEGGVLISRGGVLESIGLTHTVAVPRGATVIDVQGGFVIPGFIDVHAHWDGFNTRYPARSWEMETFLAYGVTTLHNPSADNVDGFAERSRVERGQLVGPRIFTVGDIIYGAGLTVHQDIVDMAEAKSALLRIRAEGGHASISYKNYNLPSRASRQRLLLAARNLSMLCVPEGGMNWDWDLTYIVDGMTTVEHSLPVPKLYDDILNLFALSGTGNTPTHIVNYGGAFGEQFVWANVDVPNDPKLRRFTRHDILEGLTESTARPRLSYTLFNTSASVAEMVQRGLRAHIGAHGEPPLGLNYHAEMFFTQRGGLNNYEVLRAATSHAAMTLGMHSSLGTLTPGKLADFLVYPPGVDLLGNDITETRKLRFVARGGRLWDAETMHSIWPQKSAKRPMPPLNPE